MINDVLFRLKNDDWDYLLNYDIDAEKVTQENFQHLNSQDITPEEQLSIDIII
jgi:cell division initiation protein